jgi:anti-anti-sigma regulatory factor
MSDPSPKTLALAASLDMTAASALALDLTGVRGQPLILDASAVRRLGGQCVQLLLAARMAWSMDGVSFEIADPSPEFAEALALMGCPDLIPAAPAQEPAL